jgi:hypothetical protein
MANVSKSLRLEVHERARGFCEYCMVAERAQVATFECDHCIPEVRNGPTVLENLAWACPRCNGSKGAETHATDPKTGENTPLFNPRKQSWEDHFGWSEDALEIISRTATGRATVQRLKMNRPKMIRIRKLMKRLRLHPPP